MSIWRQIVDGKLVELDPDNVKEGEDVWVETPYIGSSSFNKGTLLKSDVCGCHDCGRTFWPSEIKEWFNNYEGEDDDERPDDTAECPYCGADYVTGSADYASKADFAAAMAVPFTPCDTRIVKRLDYTKNDPCYYIKRLREGARDGSAWLSKLGEVGPPIDLSGGEVKIEPVGQKFPTVDEAVAYAKREFGINEEDWITIGEGLKVEDWIELDGDHEKTVESARRETNGSSKEIILKSDVCGCHQCGRTFWPSDIKAWHKDSAQCPYCIVFDYVVGSADYASKTAFAVALANHEDLSITLKEVNTTNPYRLYFIKRLQVPELRNLVWLEWVVPESASTFDRGVSSIDEAVAYAKREFGINEEDWTTIGEGLKMEDWIMLDGDGVKNE